MHHKHPGTHSPEYALLTDQQRTDLIAAGKRIASLPPSDYAHKLFSGKSPQFACAADPRASFAVYAPTQHFLTGPELPVVVSIHGTRRDGKLIDKMGPFAEEYGVVVLVPLFPCGVIDVGDIHNYKHLLYHDIRYDLLVLSMIEQISYIWRVKTDKFYMHGFSGGGQFGHRFLYAHPHRLLGVSFGAPGQVTLPDESLSWPHGVGGIRDVLGVEVDWDVVRAVPVHYVIGENDTAKLPGGKGGEQSKEERNTGVNRQDKIRSLKAALEKLGMVGDLDVVPGVGHAGLKCLDPVHKFLGRLIEESRKC